jgi:A/G-specific adenine glycosylase
VRTFSDRLLAWHATTGRHTLPWQVARTPYRVWVSEIMLQQTQVNTVIPYFARFLARFPDIKALAAAPLDDVLHHWSGLGYYARARNLQRAAQQILAEHGGEFPVTLDQALALPGIGRSTAGAILALSRDQRQPILDGNVKRVLTRHFAIGGWPDSSATQKILWPLADSLTPTVGVANYTQAIMDLGATLCTRSDPACASCPVATSCLALANNCVKDFPAARPRRALPERATQFLLLNNSSGEWLLERRPSSGIWGGLWSFPELSTTDEATTWCGARDLQLCETPAALAPVVHTFTHFRLTITPLRARVRAVGLRCMDSDQWLWYNTSAPARVGLATPVINLLAALNNSAKGA